MAQQSNTMIDPGWILRLMTSSNVSLFLKDTGSVKHLEESLLSIPRRSIDLENFVIGDFFFWKIMIHQFGLLTLLPLLCLFLLKGHGCKYLSNNFSTQHMDFLIFQFRVLKI